MRRSSLGVAQVSTLLVFALALIYLGWLGYGALPQPPTPTPVPPTPTPQPPAVFDGNLALSLAQQQCEFGPRPTGSPAGRQTGDWIIDRLKASGWAVETHEFTWNGVPVRNIIAKGGQGPVLMISAHYDTRPVADRDPDPAQQNTPIVGANDGASGVAVLLELARVLDRALLQNEIWLTFFDAEDAGNLPGWEWGVGSTRLAGDLQTLPWAMILLDMIGDQNQRFPFEVNSDPALRQQLWNLAAELGYGEVFIPEPGLPIIDDHIGFIRRGVPSVDIIDFDYPYHHTTADTCDKLSVESLTRVGRLMEVYVEEARMQELLPTPTPNAP